MTADELRYLCQRIYGRADWQSDAATDLAVSSRTFRRWLAGEQIPEGVADDLIEIARSRANELRGMIAEIDELLGRAK